MSLAKQSRSLLTGAFVALMLMCLIAAALVRGYVSRQSGTASSALAANQSVPAEAALAAPGRSTSQRPLSEAERFQQRYHTSGSNSVTENNSAEIRAAEAGGSSARTRGRFTLTLRAISLNNSTHDPGANQIVAREVLSRIQDSPLFDSTTSFSGKLSEEQSPGTFTFTIAARVKKPLEL
jgi:hypothetical protein